MIAQGRIQQYRHIDAVLVRATALPNVSGRDSWPTLDDEAAVEQWRSWLIQVWADVAVAEAVTVASPVLADRIAAVCQGHGIPAGQVRRMALSLARYLARMRGRATPFALFAGVAPARFGPDASALWTGQQHVRARADAVWLTEVITRLEESAALRRRLSLVMNDLAVVRGDRLIVPWRPHAGDPIETTAAEVSVRHTRAVQVVMQAASCPIQGSDLSRGCPPRCPILRSRRIERFMAELIACGALITSLRPPSTSTDGLVHVLDALNSVDASAVEEVAPLVQELVKIRADLDAASSSAGSTRRRAVADRMRVLSNADGQPLMLDLRLGCALTLPPQVAADAAHAAGTLLRLAPQRDGSPALAGLPHQVPGPLRRWRSRPCRRARRRYGRTRVSRPTTRSRGTRPRARGFHGGMNGCWRWRSRQPLTACRRSSSMTCSSTAWLPTTPAGLRHAPHMALCAEVHAPTMAALAQGDFTLMVTGVGRTAVTLTGRLRRPASRGGPAADHRPVRATTGRRRRRDTGAAVVPASASAHRERRLVTAAATRPAHRRRAPRRRAGPSADTGPGGNRRPRPSVPGVAVPAPGGRADTHERRSPAQHAADRSFPVRAPTCSTRRRFGVLLGAGAMPAVPAPPSLRPYRARARAVAYPRRTLCPGRMRRGRRGGRPWLIVRERLRLPDNVHVGESDRVLRLRLGRAHGPGSSCASTWTRPDQTLPCVRRRARPARMVRRPRPRDRRAFGHPPRHRRPRPPS